MALGSELKKRNRSSGRMGSQAVSQSLPGMVLETRPWRTVKERWACGGCPINTAKGAVVVEASGEGNEEVRPF